MRLKRTLRAIQLTALLATTTTIATAQKARGDAPAGDGAPANATRAAALFDDSEQSERAFRSQAAPRLGCAPADITGDTIQAQILATKNIPAAPESRLGDAWAVYASCKSRPERTVRGWRLPDGTAITHEQNLGLLLRAAGIGTSKPLADAELLAQQIAWAMGDDGPLAMNVRVRYAPKSPALQLRRHGVGHLRFYIERFPSAASSNSNTKSGVSDGSGTSFECDVAIARDHSATLTVKPAPHH